MPNSNLETANSLSLNGIPVVDTFAEAFGMTGTRLIITADHLEWAETAARELCGYATSVIACDVEAAIEKTVSADETPDGRAGISVLVFSFSSGGLAKALANRVGQCVLTCPTTACYNGLPDVTEKTISVGGQIRYFGDGHQTSKKLGRRRFWRIPVMDGEFICEDRFGTLKGVGGGNLILCGKSPAEALQAAMQATEAIRKISDVIMPFPGGIVRSGSKVGSQYPKLKASTNDAYCPTLYSQTELAIPEGTTTVYEIVIDGLTKTSVGEAMQAGLQAATTSGGLTCITAGNYGGKLGPHHYHLRDMINT